MIKYNTYTGTCGISGFLLNKEEMTCCLDFLLLEASLGFFIRGSLTSSFSSDLSISVLLLAPRAYE